MSDTTTIQLSLEVRAILDRIKKESGARSYAAAILWLAKKAKAIDHSQMGAFPKLKTFERDKHDRFD